MVLIYIYFVCKRLLEKHWVHEKYSLMFDWIVTTSCSGMSIAFPVRNDVNTPLLVIGAEGSGPASLGPYSSGSASKDLFPKNINIPVLAFIGKNKLFHTRQIKQGL